MCFNVYKILPPSGPPPGVSVQQTHSFVVAKVLWSTKKEPNCSGTPHLALKRSVNPEGPSWTCRCWCGCRCRVDDGVFFSFPCVTELFATANEWVWCTCTPEGGPVGGRHPRGIGGQGVVIIPGMFQPISSTFTIWKSWNSSLSTCWLLSTVASKWVVKTLSLRTQSCV